MDLPDPGIELGSPESQVDSLPTELSGKPNNKKKQGNDKIQNEYFCARGGQTGGFKDTGDVHNILKQGGGYRSAHLLLFLISYIQM